MSGKGKAPQGANVGGRGKTVEKRVDNYDDKLHFLASVIADALPLFPKTNLRPAEKRVTGKMIISLLETKKGLELLAELKMAGISRTRIKDDMIAVFRDPEKFGFPQPQSVPSELEQEYLSNFNRKTVKIPENLQITEQEAQEQEAGVESQQQRRLGASQADVEAAKTVALKKEKEVVLAEEVTQPPTPPLAPPAPPSDIPITKSDMRKMTRTALEALVGDRRSLTNDQLEDLRDELKKRAAPFKKGSEEFKSIRDSLSRLRDEEISRLSNEDLKEFADKITRTTAKKDVDRAKSELKSRGMTKEKEELEQRLKVEEAFTVEKGDEPFKAPEKTGEEATNIPEEMSSSSSNPFANAPTPAQINAAAAGLGDPEVAQPPVDEPAAVAAAFAEAARGHDPDDCWAWPKKFESTFWQEQARLNKFKSLQNPQLIWSSRERFENEFLKRKQVGLVSRLPRVDFLRYFPGLRFNCGLASDIEPFD